jgi:hypothetical protein
MDFESSMKEKDEGKGSVRLEEMVLIIEGCFRLQGELKVGQLISRYWQI